MNSKPELFSGRIEYYRKLIEEYKKIRAEDQHQRSKEKSFSAENTERLKAAFDWCNQREIECIYCPEFRDPHGCRNPRVRTRQNKYTRKRRKTDIKFRLNNIMSCGIKRLLERNGKGGKRWEDILGYSTKTLERRLKRTMPKGYTWQNFLDGELHIDHIIPVSVFNFSKPEHIDFKRCWALKNLRLLPKKENIEKSGKINKPFQPSFKV